MKGFKQKILVIGAGKMGSAIIKSWINNNINPGLLTIIEPNISKDDEGFYKSLGIEILKNHSEINENEEFNIIMIALKPQLFNKVLGDYKKYIKAEKLSNQNNVVLSIAAGKTISSLKNIFGINTHIVRSMPNLPALINEGITGIIACDKTTKSELENITKLLDCCGETLIVKDEGLIDAITAISGSGPAYVFYFAEVLYNSALNLGFSNKDAIKLTNQTLIGSSKLMKSSDLTYSKLRQNVTSKGGTTEAALEVFMDDAKLEKLLIKATKKAFNRSIKLSN